MDHIPIKFTHEGKDYCGYLSKVSGAGNTALYHLMIDKLYYGQLWHTKDGWRFANNHGTFSELADYFGFVVWQAENG